MRGVPRPFASRQGLAGAGQSGSNCSITRRVSPSRHTSSSRTVSLSGARSPIRSSVIPRLRGERAGKGACVGRSNCACPVGSWRPGLRAGGTVSEAHRHGRTDGKKTAVAALPAALAVPAVRTMASVMAQGALAASFAVPGTSFQVSSGNPRLVGGRCPARTRTAGCPGWSRWRSPGPACTVCRSPGPACTVCRSPGRCARAFWSGWARLPLFAVRAGLVLLPRRSPVRRALRARGAP